MGCEDGRGPWATDPNDTRIRRVVEVVPVSSLSLSLATCLVDASACPGTPSTPPLQLAPRRGPQFRANAGNSALPPPRNFLDHTEYGPGMSDIIINNIVVNRCILDGDMLVWDKSVNRFAEFGSNQEIAKAARDGLDSDRPV
ncbi:hypothetical protein NL676_039664 [Syzygium grande]|nr:hypothetical protein NL676_039664 [Syzygium grande]